MGVAEYAYFGLPRRFAAIFNLLMNPWDSYVLRWRMTVERANPDASITPRTVLGVNSLPSSRTCRILSPIGSSDVRSTVSNWIKIHF